MAEPKMEPVARVTGFFAKPLVAVVELSAPLRVGESIYVKGHTTDFHQTVASMQMDHAPIVEAQPGDSVGLQVTTRCRKHDVVYKLVP